MSDKTLPQSIEAEMGVLGSILIDPDAISMVADFLPSAFFYRNAHQMIYETMLYLYERHIPTDLLSVCDELERTRKLDTVGGPVYINSLINEVPTSSNVEYYARIVCRKAINRNLIMAGGKIAAIGYEEAEDGLDQAEGLIYGLGNRSIKDEVSSAGSIFADFYNQLESLPDGGSIVGVPSGLHALDAMTRGFQRSDLIILAGRPAMGKTSACLTMARNAAMTYGYGTMIFSLEMSKKQLIQRLVAIETGINVQRVFTKQLSDEEIERIAAVGPRIDEAPIWIDDTPGLTITAMRSRLRRMMAEHTNDLVVVDYLGLMQAQIDGKRIRDRLQEVSEVARELKNLAREFNVPVLALCQLSRAVENRGDKIPQLSDLRESGEIEQAADIVAFIHRDDYYAGYDKVTGRSLSDRPKTADIIIAKHRNGPVGEVVLGFEASQTKFCNLEEMEK